MKIFIWRYVIEYERGSDAFNQKLKLKEQEYPDTLRDLLTI